MLQGATGGMDLGALAGQVVGGGVSGAKASGPDRIAEVSFTA
jgi:hypothetical protein